LTGRGSGKADKAQATRMQIRAVMAGPCMTEYLVRASPIRAGQRKHIRVDRLRERGALGGSEMTKA